MLPLGPTHEDGSPYQCISAHAGDTRLISPQRLAESGWLTSLDAGDAALAQTELLRRAHERFQSHADATARKAYSDFIEQHAGWLDDYALFEALRGRYNGAPWWEWPPTLRAREPKALGKARKQLAEPCEQTRFEQFLFFDQWLALKRHANGKGIWLFGDMPIFVARDSADVWANPESFDLDEAGEPRTVAGVPPDYFSETGQRWGNPLYLWDRMQADGFSWWKARIHSQHELFDLIRIDHFRGFEAYWEIPAAEPTAIHGHWVKAPGEALFQTLLEEFHELPLVAEDLGVITDEVETLRDRFQLPGMKILQFAFDGQAHNPYLPHNHVHNGLVYTGTHDNNTTVGWYESLGNDERKRVKEYLGLPGEAMPWALIRAAYASVAKLAIVPMQDVLGLGAEARMNTPGTVDGNWKWRFDWTQVPTDLAARLRHLAETYARL